MTICRFYYNRVTKQKEKVCAPVQIPDQLILEEAGPKSPATFKLKGIVVHAGRSSNAGHYYSIVQGGDGRWLLCNDASVSVLGGGTTQEASFDICSYINRGLSSSALNTDTPYMLSYERVITDGDTEMMTDEATESQLQ